MSPAQPKQPHHAANLSSLEIMQDIHFRHPEVEIRDYQLAALDALEENEQAGNEASLVVLAPGLGKTTIMAAFARRKLLAEPDSRLLFLNGSNDILTQAHDRFTQLVGDEFNYGRFNGDGRDYDELSMLFGSFQVMRQWHPAFLRDEFSYGIVDESHHSCAPTYKTTLDYFNFKHLVGMTATPDRLDIADIRDIYGSEIYSIQLEDAIAKRLLASVDYHVITDRIVEREEVIDEHGDHYSFSDLDRRIFAPRREDEIIDIIDRYAQQLKSVKRIIFCTSIEQTERYAAGIEDSSAIHSQLTRSEQKLLLQKFRTGELSTLLTVDMFNEGIDIPEATQIVLLRQTGSKRIFLQQLGRGLRRTKNKSRVQVLDFTNNCEHLLMVDRLWRDIAKHKVVDTEPSDIYEIGLNNIHFNEETKRILPLLRIIASHVYDPAQDVPLGSRRLSAVARECTITVPALKSVLAELKVEPRNFPSKKGHDILYLESDDADRVARAVKFLFES
ncbi:MAG: hypothetical protein NVS1B7_4840 [Candidatus Saccharimonadales bacterium]